MHKKEKQSPLGEALPPTEEMTEEVGGQANGEAAAEAVAEMAEGAVAEADAPELRDGAALLRDFIAALQPAERATLLAALEHLQEAELSREAERVLTEMNGEAAFAGILDVRPALDGLISRFSWLAALPVRERYEAAYYLDRGMKTAAPTREQLLSALLSDSALMRVLAARRYDMAKRQKATLPPYTAPHGRAPAAVKAPPSNLGEAGEEAKRYLRFSAR